MKNLLYIGNKLSSHGNTPTGIEILGPLLEAEGFQLTYASSARGKFMRLIEMLAATYRNRRCDYVLIDTYSTWNFWYAFLVSQLCRILKIKYITILHGGNLPLRLKKSRRLSKMIFANSYINVAPSDYLFSAFHKAGFTNLQMIPNPIEIERFAFKERNGSGVRLLWVRGLTELADPKMAIEVAARVKPQFPDVALCMVGPDKDAMLGALKQFAADQDVDVQFTGKLKRSEWLRLAEDFDIFLNTSKVDNTPYSLLEAAALGFPIVSTNVGGIPFLFADGDEALLVPSGDASAMANAVSRIAANARLRCDLSLAARKLAETFDWKQIRKEWRKILH